MPEPGPMVSRRQLGRRLRALRAQTKLSVDDVVAHRQLGISRAKLFKLEAGKHPAKPQDVTVLCVHYGASAAETDELTKLALATRRDSWWREYGDDVVPEMIRDFLDLEPAASRIRIYQAGPIPELLQTREYATELCRSDSPHITTSKRDRYVALRLRRQEILIRPNPPHLDMVISQASLVSIVGGKAVMDRQLTNLRALAKEPHIDVSVLAFDSGTHATAGIPFIILDFPDPESDPTLVYVETERAAEYLQKPHEIERYLEKFARIQAAAIPISEYFQD